MSNRVKSANAPYDLPSVNTARFAGLVGQLEASERSKAVARGAQSKEVRVARPLPADVFSSSIAHEINQPIAAIVTNGDAAVRWLTMEVPNLREARAAVLRMLRDANRARSVIGRMRAVLSRDKPVFHDLNMNQIVKEVLLFSQVELRRSDVSVETTFSHDLPRTRGDRIQVQQVMLILILNSIEAMTSVTNRPRILRIKLGTSASGDVTMMAEDSGIGLDRATADRAFDQFFTTKAGGLGLGLPIARAIVEAHGGHLWASASTSSGAVFQFTLARFAGHPRKGAHPRAVAIA